MKVTLKNEAAGVAAPTTSESNNPTSKAEVSESAPTVNQPGAGGNSETVVNVPMPLLSTLKKVAVVDLKPHPLNAEIYGTDVDEAFVESVRAGIHQPLLVTSKNMIIAGHRRHAAAVQAGIVEVPVVVFPSDDELEIRDALIASNKQRIKANIEIGHEYNALIEIETERANQRMATNKHGQGVQPVAPADAGKARDKAASKLGISGVTGDRAGKVAAVIGKLKDSKKMNKANELREAMNKSITGAYKQAVKAGLIKVEPKKSKTKKDKPTDGTTTTDTVTPDQSVTDAHVKALESVDTAVTFLRHPDCLKLTTSQKNEWSKSIEQIVKYAKTAGITINTK